MKLLLQLLILILILEPKCFLATQEAIECKLNPKDPSRVAYTITVSQSGGADFSSVKDAVKSIPDDNNQWVKIALSPGTYKEQVQIMNKQCIFLEGQGRKTTTITFDAHNNTQQSITFDVYSHNFVAKGVTFKNSYDLGKQVSFNNTTPAVALRAFGDKHAYFECGFEGYQDTLWDGNGRHFYDSCYIDGAVDFIWGDGTAFFEKSSINVIGDGFITAQGRESAEVMSGFVFWRCQVYGKGHTFLGRAYRAFATVVFVNSDFADIIDPQGWSAWSQTGHEGDITFAEVNCNGAGADTSKRVPWKKNLTGSAVTSYSKQSYINKDGWLDNLP